jgi:hypothetical protein
MQETKQKEYRDLRPCTVSGSILLWLISIRRVHGSLTLGADKEMYALLVAPARYNSHAHIFCLEYKVGALFTKYKTKL